MLSREICQKARLSRDARFDGLFFTAVKTTKIYCRPICPVTAPKEKNVVYYSSAIEAATDGFRPCLRCRPDSSPGSAAWKGVDTTLERAIHLIDQGALQQSSLIDLSERLGISDRYLRQLFESRLGISPKRFALYHQCLFAKQLLHQTSLPITQIALASGFNSVRRFNDCFQNQIGLTPTQVRKGNGKSPNNDSIHLKLYYRPPYNWKAMQQFLAARFIPELEWIDEQSYGRTFLWGDCSGFFTATHDKAYHRFNITLNINNLSYLKPIVNNIKRVLDLDTDINSIEQHLLQHYDNKLAIHSGLRLPGTWSLFEAGIRAILGQQISVTAARNLVTSLVKTLGDSTSGKPLFPEPRAIVASNLDFFKMPASRKQTLHNFAQHYLQNPTPDDPNQWIELKGIGPWTVDYAKMRGLSDPDIYLGGDLGVQKAVERSDLPLDPNLASPWRSYLTFQLWSQL